MPSSSRVIKRCNIGSIEDKQLEVLVVQPKKPPAERPSTAEVLKVVKNEEYLEVERKQAQDIQNQAEALRAEILRKAHQEAQEIEQKAYQEGYARGQKEGHLQGLEEQRLHNHTTQEKIANSWQSIDQGFLDLEKEYEEELVQLAVQTASVFLETTTNPERLTAQIQGVLDTLVRERNITVYVHPDQYTPIAQALGEKDTGEPNQLVLAQDPSLAMTEFTCETNESCIRFSPRQKLQRLVGELLEMQKNGGSHDSI